MVGIWEIQLKYGSQSVTELDENGGIGGNQKNQQNLGNAH